MKTSRQIKVAKQTSAGAASTAATALWPVPVVWKALQAASRRFGEAWLPWQNAAGSAAWVAVRDEEVAL
jgi:hypothetical protein